MTTRNYNEEKLKTILDAAHNAIVAVDEQGFITIFNHAAEKIVGVNAEEVMGQPVDEVIPTTGLLTVLKTGQAEYSQKMKIGDVMVLTNRTPIIKDGKIVGAVAIFQDISELESISQELKSIKELNRELDTIIESISDGVYITDGEGNTLRVNSAYERISGIKAEEVIGRNMKELVEEGVYSQSVTLLVLEEREPVTITHEIKTGKEVLITGNPVFDEEGNIVRVVTTVRDLAELNSLKQQLAETRKLSQRYHSELAQLRLQQLELDDVVIQSEAMQKVIKLALRLGEVNSTVLITGESGVGKEIVAKIIHRTGQGHEGSLIKVNCGAIPENLLESELFGYEKGAFTGARKEGKPGLFELAEGGTLFLDEISELSLNLQVKLLRAIQEKEIVRVGGVNPIKIQVRIIAATNRNLEQMVKEGKFREDLYYRLNVVPIYVPPLRERREDIIPLIYHFLERFNTQFKTNKRFDPEALKALERYDWPGNVRELENTVERLVVLTNNDLIGIDDLPEYIRSDEYVKTPSNIIVPSLMPLKDAVEEVEKQIIAKALQKYSTTREVAKVLGVSQPTIVRKMKKYGLS
ncbi:sigma 54-interacting transcriptional regulator [Anoxybacter fermentans]|uniref:sigma 54-interacting transcriptional regulator n=1 Tax=Anoxybacter fermentans TaxID=1323375 RepID=UPI001F006B67|nr:sigma 54-interacting transcriptional regulator [Anoxybacter fermentans]